MRIGFGLGCDVARGGGAADPVRALLGADLLAHWDARAGVELVNGRVVAWRDGVAGYAVAQAEVAARPVLDPLGVRFAGGWLERESVPVPVGSAPVEVWICAEQDADAQMGVIVALGEGGTGASLGVLDNGNGPELFAASQDLAFAGASFVGRHVGRGVIGGGALRVETDGVAGGEVEVETLAAAGAMRVGGIEGAPWSGALAALLVTRPLPAGRAAALLGLLKARAGIA